VDGLAFEVGDAMALPFEEGVFDVVMNVEASHCYPDFAGFLREVRRVLKPGGHFLFTDFREAGERAGLEGALRGSGMEVVSCEDISMGVVKGMRMNTPGYRGLIEKLVPRGLRGLAGRFAGVEGSRIFGELERGETAYWLYHLRKGAD
jgi:ubiquinone/menaquinone biosynthesis C-methylase UbiE